MNTRSQERRTEGREEAAMTQANSALGLLPRAATNFQVRNSIPKFSGLTNTVDIITWLHAIEKYLLMEKIESEPDKIVFARNNIDYTTGNAKDIVIHMEWLSFESMKKDLISFFSVLKTNIHEDIRSLVTLTWDKKENFMLFASKIINKIKTINNHYKKEETDKIKYTFMLGETVLFTPLPPKLREKFEEKPNTVNIQEFQNLVGNIKELLQRFVLEQEESSNEDNEIPSLVVKYMQNKNRQIFPSGGRCSNCTKQGHMAKHCRSAPFCLNCRKIGHSTSVCRYGKMYNQPAGTNQNLSRYNNHNNRELHYPSREKYFKGFVGNNNFPRRNFNNEYKYRYANKKKHGNGYSTNNYEPKKVKKVSEPPQGNVSETVTNPHNHFLDILTKTN